MLITKKRIRSLNSNLPASLKGDEISITLQGLADHKDALVQAGFSEKLALGETVLPAPSGTISEYNAEGRYEPQKDQPMETIYRQVEWTHMEWHGPYQREVTSTVDVPYKRYPRKFFPPPSVELTITKSKSGDKILFAPPIEYKSSNDDSILHLINLFLELFGECSIMKGDLSNVSNVKIKRLNWHILPKGQLPWANIQPLIQPIINKRSTQPGVITARLETINKYQPDFVAIGRGGFEGYVVFGFTNKNLFVLESSNPNNATYVFDSNWKKMSQLTKAEILNAKLQKERLIHRSGWQHRVKQLLA